MNYQLKWKCNDANIRLEVPMFWEVLDRRSFRMFKTGLKHVGHVCKLHKPCQTHTVLGTWLPALFIHASWDVTPSPHLLYGDICPKTTSLSGALTHSTTHTTTLSSLSPWHRLLLQNAISCVLIWSALGTESPRHSVPMIPVWHEGGGWGQCCWAYSFQAV